MKFEMRTDGTFAFTPEQQSCGFTDPLPHDPLDLWRPIFGQSRYIPEGRTTLLALIPDRYKQARA